jgi:hypothetical protein
MGFVLPLMEPTPSSVESEFSAAHDIDLQVAAYWL